MSEFVKRRFLQNLGLKMLSLLLAVGLWLAISRDPVAEVEVTVPIEIHRIADNLEISSESIPQAQVRIRGPERLIHRLQPSDVHAEVELGNVKAGERTFDLTARQVHAPGDLEIVQIIPSQFRLSFDLRGTRQVEVKPRVIGTFAENYQISRVLVDPAVVTISGPQRRLDAVTSAITDAVDVTGTMDRSTFVTHAFVADPLVQIVGSNSVHVTVIMERARPDTGGH